jgi:hypothetical protein
MFYVIIKDADFVVEMNKKYYVLDSTDLKIECVSGRILTKAINDLGVEAFGNVSAITSFYEDDALHALGDFNGFMEKKLLNGRIKLGGTVREFTFDGYDYKLHYNHKTRLISLSIDKTNNILVQVGDIENLSNILGNVILDYMFMYNELLILSVIFTTRITRYNIQIAIDSTSHQIVDVLTGKTKMLKARSVYIDSRVTKLQLLGKTYLDLC